MGGITSVVVVEDHPLMMSGVRNVLATADDLNLIGEALSGQEALQLLDTCSPDVVLLDISLPDLDGITVLKRIKERYDCAVIMLSAHTDEQRVRMAMKYGANGYLSKMVEPSGLIDAVRSAKRGDVPVSPEATKCLVSSLREDHGLSGVASLTKREREVWQLLAQGESNAEIARELFLSLHTVKFHVHNLLRKLGLKSRTEAISAAHRRGLLG